MPLDKYSLSQMNHTQIHFYYILHILKLKDVIQKENTLFLQRLLNNGISTELNKRFNVSLSEETPKLRPRPLTFYKTNSITFIRILTRHYLSNRFSTRDLSKINFKIIYFTILYIIIYKNCFNCVVSNSTE